MTCTVERRATLANVGGDDDAVDVARFFHDEHGYVSADAGQITVNGEINKLASNIGMARNFAGVHWRTDYSDALKLGEAVALSILADQREMYGEEFSGFAIRRFDGASVTA
jgi:hypothetical protein